MKKKGENRERERERERKKERKKERQKESDGRGSDDSTKAAAPPMMFEEVMIQQGVR